MSAVTGKFHFTTVKFMRILVFIRVPDIPYLKPTLKKHPTRVSLWRQRDSSRLIRTLSGILKIVEIR